MGAIHHQEVGIEVRHAAAARKLQRYAYGKHLFLAGYQAMEIYGFRQGLDFTPAASGHPLLLSDGKKRSPRRLPLP